VKLLNVKSLVVLSLLLLSANAFGQGLTIPSVNLGLQNTDNPQEVVGVLKILGVLTVLSIAPAILVLMTSFTRIVVVLSFIRQALGTQSLPPNQLIIGLSLFITFFIMSPIFNQINTNALQPYLAGTLPQDEALDSALLPLRGFMFNQTREADLALFARLAKIEQAKTRADIPTTVLIPAFVISELKTAFQIGFIIYLPFLVIDMVVAAILMAMGMMMLPPIIISLPFKVMLFVFVDGWSLLVGSLVKSFG
jgi:flagellar biosynthetic protein FliP